MAVNQFAGRRTRALIHTHALRANCQQLQGLAPQSKVLATIKADAYGHGAVTVATSLSGCAAQFGVAFIDEAMQLREAGISAPMVLLDGCFSQAELQACASEQFIPVIHHAQQLQDVLAVSLSQPLSVWVKLDSGMHRLGFNEADFGQALTALSNSRNIKSIVAMTHLADADRPDSHYTHTQIATFNRIMSAFPHIARSIANSAGVLNWPETHLDWLRSGLLLYGVSTNPELPAPLALRPAMTLLAPVMAIRELPVGAKVGYGCRWQAQRPTRVATLAIGYGDGYPRHAKDGTPVWLAGMRVPLIGRVSMDMITVDITDVEQQVKIGDEAELWGANLSVHEVAKHCDTISYELLTRVSPRVPREEVDD